MVVVVVVGGEEGVAVGTEAVAEPHLGRRWLALGAKSKD